MEYLLAMLGLAVMCGCALGAYAVLDVMEREQEEDRTPAAARERALRPDGATSTPRRVATLRPSVQIARALPHVGARDTETPSDPADREPWATVAAYANRLDERVRGLEEQLDQLVRDNLHVKAHGRQPALTNVSGL